MIHGFYFRFFKATHCQWPSAVLAKLLYTLFLVKFLLQKMWCKPRIVSGNISEALERITLLHPDPMGRPEIHSCPANPSIDLSIIVPVYNYAYLIRGNIESILCQNTTYRYELILVDDGSTDGAKDIVLSYAHDARVKVICQKNQGIAGARNTGLNHACGRYIMFVDCDDTVTDNLVQILMDKAYAGDYDIVMCAHDLVKERNGKITTITPNVYFNGNLSGYSKDAELLNYAGLPWGKVYKKELWNDVRFLPGYWYEDTIIHALLFTQCKRFAYIPKQCYHYRWYENNFSHIQDNTNNPKCIDRYWILIPILEKADALGITESERFYTMLLKHLSAYYYSTVQGMDEEVIDALFILACDLFQKYRPKKPIRLPFMLRMTEKALSDGDINLWKLSTKYQ